MNKVLVTVAAAAMLVPVAAIAQDNAAAPGDDLTERFNEATVTPEAPFGDLQIDLTADADLKAQFAYLSDAQKDELRARCVVILDKRESFAPQAVAACEATGEIAE